MSKRTFTAPIVVLVAVIGSLVLSACSSGQTESAAPPAVQEQESQAPATQEQESVATLDGKALTQERCSVCHDLGRVESAQKTSDEWQSTVERMVSKGAKLDAAEQAAVVQYLAEAYP